MSVFSGISEDFDIDGSQHLSLHVTKWDDDRLTFEVRVNDSIPDHRTAYPLVSFSVRGKGPLSVFRNLIETSIKST